MSTTLRQTQNTSQVARDKATDEMAPETLDQPLPLVVVDRSAEKKEREQRGRPLSRVFRYFRGIFIVGISVAIGGVIGSYVQPSGLQEALNVVASRPGPVLGYPSIASPSDTIVGLATLLPDEDVITIAPPFGASDARIASLKVEEGDRFEKGEILAVFDNEPELQAAVDMARATVAAEEATLAQTRISARANLDEARASLARFEATAYYAKRELERAKGLRAKGFVSESTLDQRQAESDEARRQVEQARASLSRYDTDDIDSQVDVIVAARDLDVANAELLSAKTDLQSAYLRAPISGTVLKIHARPGETPGSDGVMNIGNTKRMTAEVEIYQTQIGSISLGDNVSLEASALPRPLRGTVSRIGLQVGRQTLIDDDPAANTDARVIEVMVTLDREFSAIASRYTNLQVIARIDIGGRS